MLDVKWASVIFPPVELLPVQTIPSVITSIVRRISENRMTYMRQMYTNLVRASGFSDGVEQVRGIVFFHHFIFRNCRFSIFSYCDFFPITFTSSKICIDSPFRRLESPQTTAQYSRRSCALKTVLQGTHGRNLFSLWPSTLSYLYQADAQYRAAFQYSPSKMITMKKESIDERSCIVSVCRCVTFGRFIHN